MSSTATPMWSMRPNIGGSLCALDAKDLGQRGDPDLELIGGRLLGREVALDLAPGGVEGLGEGRAVVAIAPGEHLDRERGAADADAGAGDRARGCPPGARAAGCPRRRAASSARSGSSRSGRAPWGRRPGPRSPARRRRSPCARRRGRRRGRGRRGRPSPAPSPIACTTPSRRAEVRTRLRSIEVAASVAPIAAATRGSSNGSRAAGRFVRTIGSTAIASASLSGPRSPGRRAASFGASSGLRAEATSISPSRLRTAAAQWVGPWISSPLRRAMPPSRSFSGPSVQHRGSPAPGSSTTEPPAPRSSTTAPNGRGRRVSPLIPLIKSGRRPPVQASGRCVSALPGSSLESRP